jgi:DNA primase catalytic core
MRYRIDTTVLKRDYPIAEVIAGYGIELRLSGRALVGRCPFHDDRGRPNLHVYPSGASWYCYRCAVGGDVIRFVERIENVGFRVAVARLTGGERVSGPTRRRPVAPKPERRRTVTFGADERACLAAAVELYQNRLATEPAALAYALARGIDRDTLDRCRVGYAAGDELAEYLRWRRLPVAAARRLGLLDRDGRDFLAGRIVVPEIRVGQPIWLVGRTLESRDAVPKYLGLPGRKPLLGWETASVARTITVVEGVFDWLTLRHWGLPGIALVGTQVRSETLHFLTRFERVFLTLDTDEPGRTATATLLQVLGERATAVVLPGVKDVADLAARPDGLSVFLGASLSQMPAAA